MNIIIYYIICIPFNVLKNCFLKSKPCKQKYHIKILNTPSSHQSDSKNIHFRNKNIRISLTLEYNKKFH
jgi:hypothetical protein